MKGLLSGIRVLDLSQAVGAPYGAMLLGDLGAEVIKIESPEGDMTRSRPGPKLGDDSYNYLAFARGKKSIVLDLATATGREAFYNLVRISDVVYENFRSGVMKRLDADYDTLKRINPRIICASITGFGSSGPYHNRAAVDPIALAMSGVTSITGEPGRPPVRPGPPIADLSAGMLSAVGIASALFAREHTGVGQKIEVSLLDACVSLLTYFIPYYSLGGGIPQPLGSGHQTVVPSGVYPTEDGYVALGSCWPRICRVIGAEHLVDDPRFATPEARFEHKEELDSILGKSFMKAKAEQWLEVLYEEDIQAAPVNTIDKVVVDPQVLHNKMIVTLKHSSGGELKLAGNPIKVQGITEEEYLPPPTLGRHTQEILTGLLGYSEEKIQKLREEQEKHLAELKAHLHKAK